MLLGPQQPIKTPWGTIASKIFICVCDISTDVLIAKYKTKMSQAYLRPCQTSMMELFCETTLRLADTVNNKAQ